MNDLACDRVQLVECTFGRLVGNEPRESRAAPPEESSKFFAAGVATGATGPDRVADHNINGSSSNSPRDGVLEPQRCTQKDQKPGQTEKSREEVVEKFEDLLGNEEYHEESDLEGKLDEFGDNDSESHQHDQRSEGRGSHEFVHWIHLPEQGEDRSGEEHAVGE